MGVGGEMGWAERRGGQREGMGGEKGWVERLAGVRDERVGHVHVASRSRTPQPRPSAVRLLLAPAQPTTPSHSQPSSIPTRQSLPTHRCGMCTPQLQPRFFTATSHSSPTHYGTQPKPNISTPTSQIFTHSPLRCSAHHAPNHASPSQPPHPSPTHCSGTSACQPRRRRAEPPPSSAAASLAACRRAMNLALMAPREVVDEGGSSREAAGGAAERAGGRCQYCQETAENEALEQCMCGGVSSAVRERTPAKLDAQVLSAS